MPIIPILVVLLVLGLALYIINIVPIESWLKQILRAVCIIGVAIWLLQIAGLVEPGVIRLR